MDIASLEFYQDFTRDFLSTETADVQFKGTLIKKEEKSCMSDSQGFLYLSYNEADPQFTFLEEPQLKIINF